jgi:type IV pilus assembly protein PilB
VNRRPLHNRPPGNSERIGDLLVAEKHVTTEQLGRALKQQEVNGRKLGDNLIQMGLVSSGQVGPMLSRQYGVPWINLARFEIDSSVTGLITAETAEKYRVVPLSRTGATLTIAMTDPTNVSAMNDIKFSTGCNLEPVVATESAMLAAIGKYYPAAPQAAAPGGRSMPAIASHRLEALQATLEEAGDVEPVDELQEISPEALSGHGALSPVVRLVHLLLMSAVQQRASDIHIEPYEKELRVRYRVDGVLQPIMSPPLSYRDAIASRVKIMARLDIAERRLPQDGRIKIRFTEQGIPRQIEFRVSVLPTLFGEKIVMRVLDRDSLMLDMTRLGFEAESLARFESAILRPWGMVLVTGPTGSGKSNTLYSCIARLNTPDTNIMTAEDPVEFNLTGINQVQVREHIGLTFAAALRSFLRQDPDAIMVGEIRDLETAGMAVKAALTGHLVLSTLHTNDAPSTIDRLTNMGIEPFLVACSVHLICAQRLVRRVCPGCAEPDPYAGSVLIHAGYTAAEAGTVQPMRGAGCAACNHTGYKGRIGLFEVLEVSEAMRRQIVAGAAAAELRRLAIDEGMITLRASGLRKVKDGITTLEEVTRETAN